MTRKWICLLLVFWITVSAAGACAQTYLPQPDHAQEIMIRTTFSDIKTVKDFPGLERLQVMAALQVMNFPDKKVYLSDNMSEDEVLRVLFQIAGVGGDIDQINDDESYRKELGLGERDAASHSDALYQYAYKSGLISKERFDSYFFTYALARNSVALRYDVALWMAKLFGIQPETEGKSIQKFSDSLRIKIEDKPFFYALSNRGLLPGSTQLGLYYPVTREWFLSMLERFEPFYIQKMGYERREGTVTEVKHEDGKRIVLLETPDGGQDMIEVPLADNQNQLFCDIAVLGKGGRQITASLTAGEQIWYYTAGKKVSFIVVQNAQQKTLSNTPVQVDGTLYYYDADLRMAVIQAKNGLLPVFLAENVSVMKNGNPVPIFDLYQHYGETIHIQAVMRYEQDLLTGKSCEFLE